MTAKPSGASGSASGVAQIVGEVRVEQPDKDPQSSGAATGGSYDAIDLNKGDLEMLPAKRRAAVLRYFQQNRVPATTQPTGGSTAP